jgi:hypothetical protein
MGILNPMVIFLRQEIHRIDRVIRTVRNSLNDLQLAIDGIIILNDVSFENCDKRFLKKFNFSLFVKYSIQSMMVVFQLIGLVLFIFKIINRFICLGKIFLAK